jgi:hypothetical protein
MMDMPEMDGGVSVEVIPRPEKALERSSASASTPVQALTLNRRRTFSPLKF